MDGIEDEWRSVRGRPVTFLEMLWNPDRIPINAHGKQTVEFLALTTHRAIQPRPVEEEIFDSAEGGIRVSGKIDQSIVIRYWFKHHLLLGTRILCRL
jgi:hypothetical protein